LEVVDEDVELDVLYLDLDQELHQPVEFKVRNVLHHKQLQLQFGLIGFELEPFLVVHLLKELVSVYLYVLQKEEEGIGVNH
jgi:hypothetical protein